MPVIYPFRSSRIDLFPYTGSHGARDVFFAQFESIVCTEGGEEIIQLFGGADLIGDRRGCLGCVGIFCLRCIAGIRRVFRFFSLFSDRARRFRFRRAFFRVGGFFRCRCFGAYGSSFFAEGGELRLI